MRVEDSVPADADRQFVTALARGLQILACFTVDARELGVGEIARMISLPKPTVWRLCHTLQTLGYLVQGASGASLRPGLRALELGYAALTGQPLGELAKAEMADIARRHTSAVSLSLLDGVEMVVLQRVQGSPSPLGHVVGGRFPISSSASGWVCLAGMSASQRKQLIARIALSDPRWASLQKTFAAALKKYEHDGYVVNEGQFNEEINAVAVAVRSPRGDRIYSLSSGASRHMFTKDKLQAVALDLKKLGRRLEVALARP